MGLGRSASFILGGLLQGVGQGIQKEAENVRERGLRALELEAQDRRLDKEIAARKGLAETESADRRALSASELSARERIAKAENVSRKELTDAEIAARKTISSEEIGARKQIAADELKGRQKLAEGLMSNKTRLTDDKGNVWIIGPEGKAVKVTDEWGDAIKAPPDSSAILGRSRNIAAARQLAITEDEYGNESLDKNKFAKALRDQGLDKEADIVAGNGDGYATPDDVAAALESGLITEADAIEILKRKWPDRFN